MQLSFFVTIGSFLASALPVADRGPIACAFLTLTWVDSFLCFFCLLQMSYSVFYKRHQSLSRGCDISLEPFPPHCALRPCANQKSGKSYKTMKGHPCRRLQTKGYIPSLLAIYSAFDSSKPQDRGHNVWPSL